MIFKSARKTPSRISLLALILLSPALVHAKVAEDKGCCPVSTEGSAGCSEAGCFGLAVTNDVAGVNAASRFLTGCSREEIKYTDPLHLCTYKRLHAPKSWTRIHLHLQLPDQFKDAFDRYFWDERYEENGNRGCDRHPGYGLENHPFVFYAGHGSPVDWAALNGSSSLSQTSLGDGKTRYLWMVSCNVLAHGPPTHGVGQKNCEYLRPYDFDPAKSETGTSALDCTGVHANALFRWGRWYGGTRSPLNPRLRMVCGSSSQVGLDSDGSERLWRHILLERMPPAEAFLAGLAGGSQVYAPVCIARGGDRAWHSPLWDPVFLTDPNSFNQSHLWIEYSVPRPEVESQVTPLLAPWWNVKPESNASSPPPPPTSMPVLAVRPVVPPPPGPPALKLPFGFEARPLGNDQQPPIASLIKHSDVCVEHHPQSGAFILTWRPRNKPDMTIASVSLADLLTEIAPLAPPGAGAAPLFGTAKLRVIDLRLDGLPADEVVKGTLSGASLRSDGCRFYLFRSEVQAGNLTVPLLGIGGESFVSLCPSSRLEGFDLAASPENPCLRSTPALLTVSLKPSRVDTLAPQPEREVFNLEEARAMATLLFPLSLNREDYEEVRYRWGYKAAPPHCRPQEPEPFLYLVYQFDFRPRNSAPAELGPLTVEVPAHKLCDPSRLAECFTALERSWKCSPEEPEAAQ